MFQGTQALAPSALELKRDDALQEIEALRAQIQGLQGAPSPLAAAKAKLQEHTSDRDKFRKLIENLQAWVPPLQA